MTIHDDFWRTPFMTIQRLTTGGLAVAVLVGLSGSTLAGSGQARNTDRTAQYGGSLDALQHGTEHGYRDGADRGREDRETKAGYHPQTTDAQTGTRGYETPFGDRLQYAKGYRTAYKTGYDDGYNNKPGRYAQLYGRQGGAAPDPTRDDPYAARSWGAGDLAGDTGYREGVTAGQQDQRRTGSPNYRDTDAYRNADTGYRSTYGDKNAYQQQYRDGFERGYQDGRGGSREPTGAYRPDAGNGASRPNAGNGGRPNQGNNGAPNQSNSTRGGQDAGGATLTVPANRQWTATNMRVTQGETIRFQVTGEIHFTASDVAISAGSMAQKLVAGAPIPSAFAGALIGRIDNGQPFGIGNLTSVRMPASGTLYLGINDDNLSDNSGQFQAVLSR
jgi:hypothetical protein